MLLYFEGKIRSRSWEDQNKVKHYVTEIYADTMQILSRGKNAPENAAAPRQETTPEVAPPPVEKTDLVEKTDEGSDDLPF